MQMRGLYQKRFKKAEVISKILSTIPFVRMIALTGSMASGKIEFSSDIDFFIVVQSGRIWTVRFLVVALLKILGQYRTDKKTAGKICPNRWQTTDFLGVYPQNLYHAQEYSQIVPLFEANGVFRNYIKANHWIKKFNLKFKIKNAKMKNYFLLGSIRKIGERILGGSFGSYLENKLKKYQKKRIVWDKRTYQEKARIIISDQILCFHPEGR